MASAVPTLRAEQNCWAGGAEVVVGVDEVGRGAWAGPVTVGAVVVPRAPRLYKVRDSKLLTPAQRARLYERIVAWAPGYAVGHASHAECDQMGMTAALRLAARRAMERLADHGYQPDRILLDGNHDYLGDRDRVETIVGGDATSLAIAAASVVAKVTRDRLMMAEAEHYPAYGFETNVGYPSPAHQCALAAFGPTAVHRRSWIFMDALPWFRRGPAQATLFPNV